MFRERVEIEAIQDEQVRVLSEKVVGLDSELMEYLTTLGKAIGRVIHKGMQDGLAAGIGHGRAGRGLADKDASIADIMGSLHLEGPAAEILEAEQIQPTLEQLMLLIHQDATSQRLSNTDVMVPLIEPLSAGNLICEASTSGVPAMTTALSTTFVQNSFVHFISAVDPGVLSAEQPTEVPSPLKIVFEKEDIADIMGSLHLEGPAAEILEAEQIQPTLEQLMLLIHPSTSGVPAMTTALSTTFVQNSFVPFISAVDPGVLSAEQPTEVPSPLKIVFEKEELDTPEHTTID
nr:hypothetical protein [Tanacetum cinerariifolium]